MPQIQDYKLDHKLKIKQDDPLRYLLEGDLDLKSNHIYLFGIESHNTPDGSEPGVEYVMANRFIRNLNVCMRVNPDIPLVIHMKTGGGDWIEGMAIYDAIRSFPYHVTILNYTHASSMSSIIFQAGNKRVMMPNSHFMFHDGSFGIEGTSKQVRAAIKFDKRVSDKTMMDIYSKAMKEHGKLSGKTLQFIKKWIRTRMDKEEDVYLTAKETCDLGLADEIFDANWHRLTEYTAGQMER